MVAGRRRVKTATISHEANGFEIGVAPPFCLVIMSYLTVAYEDATYCTR